MTEGNQEVKTSQEIGEASLNAQFASIWRRAVAFVIDAAIFVVVYLIILGPLLTWLGNRQEKSANAVRLPFSVVVLTSVLVSVLGLIILNWLYFALFESGKRQATIGKRIMGIYVTDYRRRRIDFGRASGRFFSKFISLFLLGAGFIMAPFTPKKQALHDIMAQTIVLRRR